MMKINFKSRITVSALLLSGLSFATSASVDVKVFEQLCRINASGVQSSLTINQPISFIPNDGNKLLTQTDEPMLTVDSIVEHIASQFNLSRDCAEFLVVSGQVEHLNQGDLLARVYFDFDATRLTPVSKQILDRMAELAAQSNALYKATGHTDDTGSHNYNLALGIKRAQAVEQYLKSKHVAQVVVESGGETAPIASNNTKEGRAQNRRVDISY
ncbi:OmpA family protein [Vibrio sp. SM6]|uniref:OmpA family protein n=1 Tax=Vibrio agarilyticus TaxID=2726741 RepID=A0A7X8TRZ3_9VIBR|nr:OmpA family protein [Vibrio agarilyticus]NLS13790.1 OmpA family protein [Vibrio agarilyticus]